MPSQMKEDLADLSDTALITTGRLKAEWELVIRE